MEISAWKIVSKELDQVKRFSRDALFTTGNGVFGIRGFFEEETEGIGRLGGIYMAGVFGQGYSEVCSGPSSELCNLPQVLRLDLTVDGKRRAPSTDFVQNFTQELNLQNGEYSRSYQLPVEGALLSLTFRRFADLDTLHQIWQSVTITCLEGHCQLGMMAMIDTDVSNLNWQSCEPLPIQPGRKHFSLPNSSTAYAMELELDNQEKTRLFLAQKLRWLKNQRTVYGEAVRTPLAIGEGAQVLLQSGDQLTLEKVVHIYADFETSELALEQSSLVQRPVDYNAALSSHSACWNKRWKTADFRIQGLERDQGALRYNIFELLAACPLHQVKASIGARGLSGEMYEGCVFWDNEIFQLPFFCWSEPLSAKRLLSFRYQTLDEARKRAAELWFRGALYPWQVDRKGREQTIEEGGAFYAIHIVADIAYSIGKYMQITGDWSFLPQGGGEILLETARFWLSRCDYDENDQKYHIRAVRGPNEYDVYVDDNAYTNTMAAYNLTLASKAVDLLRSQWPKPWEELQENIRFTEEEYQLCKAVAENLAIPYLPGSNLILEDNRYHLRRPLPLAKAKPTAKRIIDSTLPYEALPLYQVTKQADVVLLMCLFGENYSVAQKALAFDYYEPRTAHDSSLSYAPYGLMAAILNRQEYAYSYFEKCALLEVEDRQLNSISGLHYANFGGTWQIAFHGFAGITEQGGMIHVKPQLPAQWIGFQVCFYFQASLLQVTYQDAKLKVELLEWGGSPVKICVEEKIYSLTEEEFFLVL